MEIEYIKDGLYYNDVKESWLTDEARQYLDIIIKISDAFGCNKLTINVDSMWTDAEFDNQDAEVSYGMAIGDAIYNASLQNVVKNNGNIETKNIKVLKDGVGWVL